MKKQTPKQTTQTPKGTTINFVKVQAVEKFRLLITLMQKRSNQKIVVIFFTRQEVQFASKLFYHLKLDHNLSGENNYNHTLVSQDQVNSLVGYELIVLFEAKLNIPKEKCQILVFLSDNEIELQENLIKDHNATELTFAKNKLTHYAMDQLHKLTQRNYQLYQSAVDAYKSYFLVIYHSQTLEKQEANLKSDPYQISKLFGLQIPPKMTNYVLKKPQTSAKEAIHLLQRSKKIQKKVIPKQSVDQKIPKKKQQQQKRPIQVNIEVKSKGLKKRVIKN